MAFELFNRKEFMAAQTKASAKQTDEKPENDSSIRAIGRGLSVLKVINRMGSANLTEISRETQIPYPTVCRIVNTLMQEEMVEREPNRKRYRPTVMVRSLAVGYQLESRLVSVARPLLETLCKDLVWPVSLATRVGSCMVLLDSTHHMTSLTLSHYYPGYTIPITECATGKAYLAHCDQTTRKEILENIETIEFSSHGHIKPARDDEEYWAGIREQGYSVQMNNAYSADPGKTTSIGAPIFIGDTVASAIAVIFFKSSLKLKAAEEAFALKLVETAKEISLKLNDIE